MSMSPPKEEVGCWTKAIQTDQIEWSPLQERAHHCLFKSQENHHPLIIVLIQSHDHCQAALTSQEGHEYNIEVAELAASLSTFLGVTGSNSPN